MKTYFSNILLTQEIAEKKLSAYQPQVEKAGGSIRIQTLKEKAETTTTMVVEKVEHAELKKTVEEADTTIEAKGPALYITLPDEVEISSVVSDENELNFQLLM